MVSDDTKGMWMLLAIIGLLFLFEIGAVGQQQSIASIGAGGVGFAAQAWWNSRSNTEQSVLIYSGIGVIGLLLLFGLYKKGG